MNILITGTSSGIGNGLAHQFLLENNNVWGVSRRVADDLSLDPNYKHLQLDLTNYNQVDIKFPEFINGIVSFDLIILNAGILGEIKWMSEIGLKEMKQVMEINVWSNKYLLDYIFAKKITVKQVVGISSKASLRSTPGWGPYSLSKAGLNMLMNIYAKEKTDTHFGSFAPGLVDSEIQETISNIKETDKYPTIKKLQNARNTIDMPDAKEAAKKLIGGIKKLLSYESGSFIDIREM